MITDPSVPSATNPPTPAARNLGQQHPGAAGPSAQSLNNGSGTLRLPDLPDVPGLPSVPSNSVGVRSGEDVDFDDLTRRFEELKKRK